MPSTPDPSEIARTIAHQAEKLEAARNVLREQPELVAEVVDYLTGMVRSVDRVLNAASDAFQEHAATAVTSLGNQPRGSARAAFASGLLAAASSQLTGLRNTLMGIGAEASDLVWPEHDLVDAEELRNYQRFLEQRERQLNPDPDPRSTLGPQAPGPTGRR